MTVGRNEPAEDDSCTAAPATNGHPNPFREQCETIYRENAAPLNAFLARCYKLSRADREDLIADTFVRALGTSVPFRENSRPLSYLIRIAIRLHADAARKAQRRNRSDMICANGDITRSRLARDLETEVLDGLEAADRIPTILSGLTEDQRVALYLSTTGMPAEEIAGVMGISMSAVYTKVSRAKAKARELHETLSERRSPDAV